MVRGSVSDSRTQTPIAGAIVSIDEVAADGAALPRTQAALALSSLSDEKGTFSVNATRSGRFVLTVKRVGLRRFESEPFQLGAGETRRFDVTLEPIDFSITLPRVSVTADTPCASKSDEATRVAAIWDEVRTALTASRLAIRDRAFKASIVGYTRFLAPTTLRVQQENQSVRRGVTERPFRSLEASALSADGFIQAERTGGNIYYAPDAEVLAAPEFLRDHCFSLASDRRNRRGLIGLAFAPVRTRRLPDVRGSFWIDSATRELRLVDFGYINVPESISRGEARGEVHFAVSPKGTWYVSRWFIRMPEFGRSDASAGVPGGTRLEVVRYKEEGGDVTPDGAADLVRVASITGRALDSTGSRPLVGATVRVSGTEYRARVRSDGHFTIDSLPGGVYTLRLEHPGYDSLALPAAEQELEVAPQARAITVLQASRTVQLLRTLCDILEFPEETGVLRVVVTDTAGAPQAATRVRIGFDTFESGPTPNSIVTRPKLLEGETDAGGALMFCNVAARKPVRIEATVDGKREPVRQQVTLPAGGIQALVLKPR